MGNINRSFMTVARENDIRKTIRELNDIDITDELLLVESKINFGLFGEIHDIRYRIITLEGDVKVDNKISVLLKPDLRLKVCYLDDILTLKKKRG